MKRFFFALFFMGIILSVYANGQQEGATAADAYIDYMSWVKVNQETITGDETGVLRSAHQGSKGFREIYVNDIGRAVAYGEADYPYPEGSIILKESYDDKAGVKGKLADITIMVKREEGYDPENGNWEYVMANSELKVSNQGKIGLCINCHQMADSRDFIFWDSSF